MKKLGIWISLVVLASCGSEPPEPAMDSVMVAESALSYPPGCNAGNTTVAAVPRTGDWVGHADVLGDSPDPYENWILDGVYQSSTPIHPVYRFTWNPAQGGSLYFTATVPPSIPGGWNCSGKLTKVVVAAGTAGNCNVSGNNGTSVYFSAPAINDPFCQQACSQQWVTVPSLTTCAYNTTDPNAVHSHTLCAPGACHQGIYIFPWEQIAFAPADSAHPNLMFLVADIMWDIDWYDWYYERADPPSPPFWGFQVLKR